MSPFITRIIDRASTFISAYTTINGGIVVSGGAIAAWAAWATEVFQTYSPFSWVISGMVGALVVALALWAAAYASDRRVIRDIRAQHQNKPNSANPLESSFRKERINIHDMAPPWDNKIVGKTFIECQLIGPANILFLSSDGGYSSITNMKLIDSSAAELKPDHIPAASVIFQDCIITGCTLVKVVLMVHQPFADESARRISGIHWITLGR